MTSEEKIAEIKSPHEAANKQIQSLRDEVKAAKELWITAQNACAKHARMNDVLQDEVKALREFK